MKYAITDKQTNEFYPDPLYDTEEKARIKIEYLENYQRVNNMKIINYGIEALTDEREKQHEQEWNRYKMMID